MKKILIDTNILQYGIHDHYADTVADIFQTLRQDYELEVSAFTSFEIYRGIAYRRIARVNTLVRDLAWVDVDLATFKLAAALTTCYQKHVATRPYVARYSDGDVVLAACAFRYNAMILTANGNDFPRPFFEEDTHVALKANDKLLPAPTSLLCPNTAYLNQAIHTYLTS